MASDAFIPAEQVTAFLAQPPPRRGLPPPLVAAARRRAAPASIGCLGLFFCVLALPLLYVLIPWNIVSTMRLRDAPTAPGQIESTRNTGSSVNRVSIWRFDYTFTPPGGEPQRGRSYATGKPWSEGDAVTVRYLASQPGTSCLEGGRLDIFGPGASVIAIALSIAGIVPLTWFLRRRKRVTDLLVHGLVKSARVTGVKRTSLKLNDQPVHEISLAFEDGPPVVVSRFFPPLVALVEERLRKGQPIVVLLDPARPKDLLFPERL